MRATTSAMARWIAAVLGASTGLWTACAEPRERVFIDLRLAAIDGHGRERAACAPRDPVAVSVKPPWGAPQSATASRGPDLRVEVRPGDRLEATRVPGVDLAAAPRASNAVWVAEWVVPGEARGPLVSDERTLASLAWCDVLVEVGGRSRGTAELRPGSGRWPAGTFASLAEVRRAFPDADIATHELPAFEAAAMSEFWRERERALWQRVACDAGLRGALERDEPEAFAEALAELSKRGSPRCDVEGGDAAPGAEGDRVR